MSVIPFKRHVTEYAFTVTVSGPRDIRLQMATVENIQGDDTLQPVFWISLVTFEQVHGVCAWLARWKHQWNAWGRIAAIQGGEALDRFLIGLWNEDYLVPLDRVQYAPLADPRDVWVGAQMADGGCRHLATHRFSSPRKRAAFLRWLDSLRGVRDRPELDSRVAIAGWLEGPHAVGALLDGVARSAAPLRRKRKQTPEP